DATREAEEMEHQVAPELAGAIAEAREQEEPRGLDRRRPEDHDIGVHATLPAALVDERHAGHPRAARVHAVDERARLEPRAGEQRMAEERHGRAAAGADRPAVAGAEAAGGPPRPA